ncbi:hypothetical protein [Streptomyces sp. NPDC087270]|uniref:protein kinase domain-containing protein n=1 Tax=Streptomyces sp. NPDC087270 TaxID=3365774 RepID=UPI00380C1B3A
MDDHEDTGADAGTGIPGGAGEPAGPQQPAGAGPGPQKPAGARRPARKAAPKPAARKAPGKPPAEPAAAKGAPAAPSAPSDGTASPEPADPAGEVADGDTAPAEAESRTAPTDADASGTKAAPAQPAARGRKSAPARATPPAQPAARAKKSAPAKKTAAAGATKGAKATASPRSTPAPKSDAAPDAPVAAPEAATTAQPPAQPPVPVDAPVVDAPTAAPWQVPGYAHESVPGAGPSSEVVRATREADGVPVAITYLAPALAEDQSFRATLRAEAERLGTLESPYVARLYAYVEDGPHAAIVREPVEGAVLAALLRENGATTPEAALAVLKGTLLGLSAAHEAGIAGGAACDPAHLLVTAAGTPSLVDLGGTPSAAPGTPGAPVDVAPVDVAADLHTATAACRACLTGEPLHASGADPQADVPAAPVRPLLARGLVTDPAERPQSAIDFAVELEAVAVAAYGEAWEERGRQELASLVGALTSQVEAVEAAEPAQGAVPLPLPAPAPIPTGGPAHPDAAGTAGTAGTATGAGIGGLGIGRTEAPDRGTDDGDDRRLGRRTKALLIAVAAVIVAGAITATAVVIGGKHDAAAADTTPTATVSRSSATTPPPTTTSPSADATTASPTASNPPSTPTSAPAAPSTPPTTAATTPTAPSHPPATHATPPPKPHAPHVASVAITGVQCDAGGRTDTANATIRVRYDGSAGTVRATWWRSATGTPRGAVDLVSPQTAQFPKGASGFAYTVKLSDVAKDPDRPYVGITVSTSPAASSGNNSFAVVCR